MIQIERLGRQVGPIAVCDHCKTEITDASDASVMWRQSLTDHSLGTTLYFGHLACEEDFMRAHPMGEQTWSSIGFSSWLAYLTRKVNWDSQSTGTGTFAVRIP